ncbi:MAG: ribonuclease [Hyphomicrobiaceae bacterium]|nr:ribonuclease [Hyphomicrobiaceae bacterium]
MKLGTISSALTLVLLAGAALLAFGPEIWQQVDPAVSPPPAAPDIQTVPTAAVATGPLLSGTFTLAISWQPAFCEQQSLKPECQGQKLGDFSADHFALHGLWPEPQGTEYCGVSNADEQADNRGDWRNLPRVRLPAALRARLEEAMPGTLSYLDRHEWTKHGTCSGAEPEAYFQAAIALLDEINASAVRNLFVASVGKSLTADTVRTAFDQAFGAGSGARVTVECGDDANRHLINELRISIKGEIGSQPDLAALLRDAASRQRGCPAGIIDPVGLQ